MGKGWSVAHVPLEEEHSQEGIQAPGACPALKGDSPEPSPHLLQLLALRHTLVAVPHGHYLRPNEQNGYQQAHGHHHS